MKTGPFSHLAAEPRRNRTIYTVGYIMLGAVGVRELTCPRGTASLVPCVVLLAALVLLTATDPLLFRRYRRYPLCLLPGCDRPHPGAGLAAAPYQDVWGLLYVLAGVQARLYLPPRPALVWAGVSASYRLRNPHHHLRPADRPGPRADIPGRECRGRLLGSAVEPGWGRP